MLEAARTLGVVALASARLLLGHPLPSIAACSNTTVASGNITYAYDPDGRLVGVVNASGSVATYQYDVVGNVLAISRPTAAVSVLAMSPSNGVPGNTCVTIYGSGFSATLSQDTVQFNGTTATLSYATPTTIVATVPSGAHTGPVSVTSPSGSATSSSSFIIEQQ
jgi:YD repeat-containing protein